LGRPVYLATSRKDYLRDLLGLPPEALLAATEAAVAYAMLRGSQLVRSHDVAQMVRVRATLWAIREAVGTGAPGRAGNDDGGFSGPGGGGAEPVGPGGGRPGPC